MSVAVTRIVTSAILQATSWTQEFATSPAHYAPDNVLAFLRSYHRAEKIHRESRYSISP